MTNKLIKNNNGTSRKQRTISIITLNVSHLNTSVKTRTLRLNNNAISNSV